MMLNYVYFSMLFASLFLCLWLTRQNVLLKKRNLVLCNKLFCINNELEELSSFLKKLEIDISYKLENLEEEYIEYLEEEYSHMAEELACKREEEADRKKEEALLSHIEEDCDQCCQDGADKCSVKNDVLPTHGKIKNQFGNTIHVS